MFAIVRSVVKGVVCSKYILLVPTLTALGCVCVGLELA